MNKKSTIGLSNYFPNIEPIKITNSINYRS